MNMQKLIDYLLEKEELKDVPITIISIVVSSVFDVMANQNVFFKEEL